MTPHRLDSAPGPAGINAHSLGVRTLTAALYALVVAGALLWGDRPSAALFGVLSGLCAAEFFAMERHESRIPNEFVGVAAATAMPLAALWGLSGPIVVLAMLVAASLVWHMRVLRVRTADTAVTVFGAAYTGLMLSHIVLLRQLDQGLVLVVALILSIWASDVFAYVVGSMFGRHKMAPLISPKKSWEGFYAGVFGCVAVWAAVPYLNDSVLSLKLALGVGFAVAISSVIGDLAESRIKREVGLKDSGTLLPGHGGFLDRLDSLILAGVVAYWILRWSGLS